MNVDRRRFFASLAGLPVAGAVAGSAVVTPTPVVLPDPAEMHVRIRQQMLEEEFRVELYTHEIPADCMTWCASDFAGRWWVTDRVTAVTRLMCDRCKDEFVRQPHRLMLPQHELLAHHVRLGQIRRQHHGGGDRAAVGCGHDR